jgi:fructose-1,6-bisphosphatase/inositol monophosphatase family enzyme
MNGIEHEQALEFAQHLADVGGEIALRYFRTPLEISCKPDQSPVTAADFEVECTLRQLIRERYPLDGIIGLLASGHCDLVVESGLEPCDYLPLIPVVHGAGGRTTDWKGGPLGLNSGGRIIAAANKLLLDAVIDALEVS